jgi:2-keto-4-pentenoate hydratase
MRTEESIAVADLLAELRFNGNILDELPAELRPRDLTAAYSVQEALVERLQARYGGVRIGYKIACTNGSAQRLLNTNAPVFGCLVSSLVFQSPANLNGDDFIVRGIEAEFAFEIVRDVPSPGLPHTAESIADYLGRVFPAIELVGHRFADWNRFDASILVADNAVHQAWIPGAGISDWRDLNLASHGVQVIVNGEPKLTGSGANVLGHPLKALAWLANELPKWGRSLKAGELVTTGTCTDVYTAQPRDGIRVDFGVLGNVELSFVGSSA